MPLLSRLALAWIAGITLARWLNLPWPVIVIASLPPLSALFLYRHSPRALTWAVLGLALLAGALRFAFSGPTIDESHVAFYNDNGSSIRLTGLVVEKPDVRDDYNNLRLQAEKFQSDTTRPVEGLVLVRAPRYPEYAYGDRLAVTGNLETPPIFEDFSYKDYLARSGIHSLIRRSQIELVETGQGQPFWLTLFAFKAHASETINRILAEPYASLLNGILLGVETGIPEQLYESFNLTGTSHIIVISGSNIALIAGILLLLGQRVIGKRYAPPLAMAGIVVYTFLVGADAAVSRAAVMGIIWMLAVWSGRPGLALNSLFASGLVLTVINPLILWDVGFQLSFLATLGLILLVPPLERTFFNLLSRWLNGDRVGLAMALLSEMVIVTLAAQIITGPLILYHFGRLSLISLLTNLLILPVQPPIMIVGGLATLAGMLWLPLGQVIGWLVWLPLAWSVWIVELTARLPYASLELGDFPAWLMVLLYLAIAAGTWSAQQPQEKQQALPHFHLPEIGSLSTRLWLGGAGVVVLLIWLAVWTQPDGRLHVAFLDVGQGDAILITTPGGKQILIDGGPSATALNWRLGQAMPFWDRSLDMVINTHPDGDHLGGLVPLLDRYSIDQAVVSGLPLENALWQEWEAGLVETGLAPVVGQAGMQLALGDGFSASLLQ